MKKYLKALGLALIASQMVAAPIESGCINVQLNNNRLEGADVNIVAGAIGLSLSAFRAKETCCIIYLTDIDGTDLRVIDTDTDATADFDLCI